MRKFLYIIAFVVALACTGKAQNLIAVNHNGAASFFTTIAAAYTACLSGDTIYIPGGVYDATGLNPITKTLHIYGVGHNPDSSSATAYTWLSGSVAFNAGSDNSTIEGCYISSGFSTGYCSYIIIRRCKANALVLGNTGLGIATNYTVINSVFDQISLISVQSSGFYNNIFKGASFSSANTAINNEFDNNIFIATDWINGYNVANATNCIFKNNIFLIPSTGPLCAYNSVYSNFQSCSSSNLFYNNLFVSNSSSSIASSNVVYNNIYGQTQSTIFINQSGGTFNYAHNYQLQSSCPGKNAGTDGTDIGIYGGTFPWKDGSIPSNPHIQFKSVAPKTTIQNTLPVQIKVKAQDN